LRATRITLCFVLADDLNINVLKFVSGHRTVVQPASINIVFGYKQTRQYSRIHQMIFLSELSVVVRKLLDRVGRTCNVHITLRVEHFIFMHFIRSVGYSAI